MTAKERLKLVLEQHCKTSVRSIEMDFKWGNGSLMKPDNLNLDRLEKIHLKYPEINLCWILFGQGEMLIREPEFPEIIVAAEPEENYSSNDNNFNELLGRLKEARNIIKEKDNVIANLNRELGELKPKKNNSGSNCA